MPSGTTAGGARRALIVRGGWDGHEPVATTELVVPMLERRGFEVRIEESTAVYADPTALAGVGVIVQAVTMSEISTEEVEGLRAAVEAGAGFAGWHGGIVDAFRATPEYLQLVGGQFVAHPGAPGGGHPRHGIRMTDAGREHPITRGIDDFELETEQYWVLHDDLVDVLATTTIAAPAGAPWRRPVTSPAVWTREWGAGRVFVATPGHDAEVLRHPHVAEIVERGIAWAARTA